MSAGSNFLPLPKWTQWLLETFNPLVERVANVEKGLLKAFGEQNDTKTRLTKVESRLAALEGTPQEPEEPEQPQEPEEPQFPKGDFDDEFHKVAPRIDERFDPSRPTTRDGMVLSDFERKHYDATMRALLRSDPNYYSGDKMFATKSSYDLGRHGQVQQETAFGVLARTGDARILDEFVRRWRIARADMVVAWRADNIDVTHRVFKNLAGAKIVDGRWVLSGGKTPWSPHLKWLYDWGEPSEGRGTDLNNLQNIKPWAVLLQFLWALELNRGKPSPAGYDYGAEADAWMPILRGFIETYTSDSGEPWEDNYLGLDGGMLWEADRSRAKPGQWPFFVRGEGHAIYNAMMICYYCGLLGNRGWDIPNWQAAIPAADTLAEYIREKLYVETVDSRGQPALIARGGGKATVISATYTNYLALSLQHIRDIGRWDDLFTSDDLVKLARSYVDMHRPDGTTKKNLACGIDRTGHGWDVSGGSDRTVTQQAINGFCAAMWWEEDNYLFEVGTNVQRGDFAGGYADAKSHIIPAIQFVDVSGVGL